MKFDKHSERSSWIPRITHCTVHIFSIPIPISGVQHLTELELRRRQLTETLSSSSLAKKAIEMLTLRNELIGQQLQALGAAGAQKQTQAQILGLPNDSLMFDINCDSKHYEIPKTILVPIPKISTTTSTSGDSRMLLSFQYLLSPSFSIQFPLLFIFSIYGHS